MFQLAIPHPAPEVSMLEGKVGIHYYVCMCSLGLDQCAQLPPTILLVTVLMPLAVRRLMCNGSLEELSRLSVTQYVFIQVSYGYYYCLSHSAFWKTCERCLK